MFNAIILQAAAMAAMQARSVGLISSRSPGTPPTRDDRVGGIIAWASVAALACAGIIFAATMIGG